MIVIDVQIDDTWNVVVPEYETGEKFIPYVNRHGERHHDANNIESASAREIIELRSNAQSLADALEFYADRANYQLNHNDAVCDAVQDGGDRAQAALANYRKDIS